MSKTKALHFMTPLGYTKERELRDEALPAQCEAAIEKARADSDDSLVAELCEYIRPLGGDPDEVLRRSGLTDRGAGTQIQMRQQPEYHQRLAKRTERKRFFMSSITVEEMLHGPVTPENCDVERMNDEVAAGKAWGKAGAWSKAADACTKAAKARENEANLFASYIRSQGFDPDEILRSAMEAKAQTTQDQ